MRLGSFRRPRRGARPGRARLQSDQAPGLGPSPDGGGVRPPRPRRADLTSPSRDERTPFSSRRRRPHAERPVDRHSGRPDAPRLDDRPPPAGPGRFAARQPVLPGPSAGRVGARRWSDLRAMGPGARPALRRRAGASPERPRRRRGLNAYPALSGAASSTAAADPAPAAVGDAGLDDEATRATTAGTACLSTDRQAGLHRPGGNDRRVPSGVRGRRSGSFGGPACPNGRGDEVREGEPHPAEGPVPQRCGRS